MISRTYGSLYLCNNSFLKFIKLIKKVEGRCKLKMKKILRKVIGMAIIFGVATIWVIQNYSPNRSSMLASSNFTVSNTKIEWGVKRGENHAQPELRKNQY